MSVTILTRETGKEFSQRRLETYDKYNRMIQWGRREPVPFTERIFGISLLDYQKYIVDMTWRSQFAIWLICRNGAKTTDGAIYTMLRSVLLPFHTTYFISNVGAQAKETFMKMEQIAKNQVESFAGTTDVFLNEVEISNLATDGFSHGQSGFSVSLFNNSKIFTLNSDPTNVKGRRANLLYIDESGWVTDELMVQVEQFANQSEDFKLGGGIDLELEPKNFPRQLIYASSASDTQSAFYGKFKDFSKQMMMGNTSYFTCDFDIEAVLTATFNGGPYKSLISKDKVETQMRTNPEKGMRELYNKFTSGQHEGQILTPRDIRLNTKQYLPILSNPKGQSVFLLSWDSARLNDNSVIEIAELIDDPDVGWRMRIADVHSLVDVDTKKKTPMRLPDQVEEFKRLLLTYNGSEFGRLDYENIDSVVGDAGAAGQLIGGVSDYLLDNWVGPDGKKHKGLIDTSHKANETAKYRFPDAVDKMKLVDPKANRNLLFQAIEDMVKLGVVDFPIDYDIGEDNVVFMDEVGNEEKHNLSVEEQISLANIDLLKTEITTMCKYTNAGAVTYNFPPDKRNNMHDDRVFAFGLLCWRLAQLRRGQVVNKPSDAVDYTQRQTLASAVDWNVE